MKYPEKQYAKLVATLKILDGHFDLSAIHPSTLHYIAYQQQSSGQLHNAIVLKDGLAVKAHTVGNDTTNRIIPIDDTFELYPEGCNDNHCVTAVKRALKEIGCSMASHGKTKSPLSK